jgi:peptidoglycan-associated lipoprotein
MVTLFEKIMLLCNKPNIKGGYLMKKLLVVFLLIFAVSCTKTYTRPSEEEMKPAEEMKEEVMKVEEEAPEEIAYTGEDVIGERDLSPAEVEEIAKTVFSDIYFAYDKYNILPDARPMLDQVATFMGENSGYNVVIEGHCDERGTNEYNLALGERRAKSTKNYLVSLGVQSARISTVTFGEEKPLCMDQNETCWQSNRRAHFVVTGRR